MFVIGSNRQPIESRGDMSVFVVGNRHNARHPTAVAIGLDENDGCEFSIIFTVGSSGRPVLD